MPDSPARRRSRRTVLTVAAAAFVVLAPTACDYAVATTDPAVDPGSSLEHGTGHGGRSGHGGAPTASGVQTVPAGNIDELEPEGEISDQTPEGETPDGRASAQEGAGDEVGPTTEATPTAEESATEADAPPSGAAAEESAEESAAEEAAPAPAAAPPVASGLEILGSDCSISELGAHDGFQNAPRCVAIAFGEVAGADRSPSLLITDAPDTIASGQPFTLQVSTRNLVRDRFLGAAAGGYYRESSFLNDEGIQRGHFHTACRLLPSLDEAPDAEPAPEFFVATQDNGGGAAPDVVGVPVTGITGSGELQCTVWAGDGSHRVPMMQRANQTPAFDAVRITVE